MEQITVSSPLTKTVALQSVGVTVLALASNLTKQLTALSQITRTVNMSSRIDPEEA